MLGRRSIGAPPAEAPGLPQVLHDAPATVLVIDLDRQQVVYANAAAVAPTGERVRLPVDVDAWSDAAGLTDVGGRPMSELASESMSQCLRGASTSRSEGVRCESTSPLSLVVAGVPVAGEPVAVHDSARRGSSLSEADRQAGEGRLLWVTGFTLSSAAVFDGEGPQSRAMIVFQQLSGTELGDRRRLALLRDRAVIATEMSFTITDPRTPDHPLVWVNPSFTRLTGYRFEEVVGRNCRLLQGPNTDPDVVRRIGEALRRCEPITEVLLN